MNHNTMKATTQIGKSGITETAIKQIKEQLKKYKVVKVKFLPSAIESNKKELMEQLAKKTSSKIIHKVGFVVVLEKLK